VVGERGRKGPYGAATKKPSAPRKERERKKEREREREREREGGREGGRERDVAAVEEKKSAEIEVS